MGSKKPDSKTIAMLVVGAALLLCGPRAVELWQSYQETQAELDAKTDGATEKLKDFFLDEKEPYHPDRPVSDNTPKAEPAKKEIIVFSADWCDPCKRWKQFEQEKFRKMGYSFAYGDEKTVSRLPHFIVIDGTKTFEVSGYMSVERLESELRR